MNALRFSSPTCKNRDELNKYDDVYPLCPHVFNVEKNRNGGKIVSREPNSNLDTKWAGGVPGSTNGVGMRCFHPMDLGLGPSVFVFHFIVVSPLPSPGMEDREGSNRVASHSR